MSKVFNDQYHGVGGSYEMRDGKRVRIDQEATHHPDGDRARDPDGNAHDKPEGISAALPAPASEAPPEEPSIGRRRGRLPE